ncbi:MAG: hypothetical protein MR409_07865 [Lachnospiraceae bacterium]|nr:hypothetical protein [Lachnospiraceae bacterium]
MRAKKLCILLCSVLILGLLQGCAGKDNNKKTNDSIAKTEATATPTNSPLPTAEVSVDEGADGKSKLSNTTAGYNVSYDSKLLKVNNKDSSISFVPSDKKAKDELNLFLNITEVNADSAQELGDQLMKSYKDSIKKKETTIGTGKTSAECYTITDSKKVVHEVYVISSGEKGYYIELKCPSKYKKKYMASFNDILNSIEF